MNQQPLPVESKTESCEQELLRWSVGKRNLNVLKYLLKNLGHGKIANNLSKIYSHGETKKKNSATNVLKNKIEKWKNMSNIDTNKKHFRKQKNKRNMLQKIMGKRKNADVNDINNYGITNKSKKHKMRKWKGINNKHKKKMRKYQLHKWNNMKYINKRTKHKKEIEKKYRIDKQQLQYIAYNLTQDECLLLIRSLNRKKAIIPKIMKLPPLLGENKAETCEQKLMDWSESRAGEKDLHILRKRLMQLGHRKIANKFSMIDSYSTSKEKSKKSADIKRKSTEKNGKKSVTRKKKKNTKKYKKPRKIDNMKTSIDKQELHYISYHFNKDECLLLIRSLNRTKTVLPKIMKLPPLHGENVTEFCEKKLLHWSHSRAHKKDLHILKKRLRQLGNSKITQTMLSLIDNIIKKKILKMWKVQSKKNKSINVNEILKIKKKMYLKKDRKNKEKKQTRNKITKKKKKRRKLKKQRNKKRTRKRTKKNKRKKNMKRKNKNKNIIKKENKKKNNKKKKAKIKKKKEKKNKKEKIKEKKNAKKIEKRRGKKGNNKNKKNKKNKEKENIRKKKTRKKKTNTNKNQPKKKKKGKNSNANKDSKKTKKSKKKSRVWIYIVVGFAIGILVLLFCCCYVTWCLTCKGNPKLFNPGYTSNPEYAAGDYGDYGGGEDGDGDGGEDGGGDGEGDKKKKKKKKKKKNQKKGPQRSQHRVSRPAVRSYHSVSHSRPRASGRRRR